MFSCCGKQNSWLHFLSNLNKHFPRSDSQCCATEFTMIKFSLWKHLKDSIIYCLTLISLSWLLFDMTHANSLDNAKCRLGSEKQNMLLKRVWMTSPCKKKKWVFFFYLVWKLEKNRGGFPVTKHAPFTQARVCSFT